MGFKEGQAVRIVPMNIEGEVESTKPGKCLIKYRDATTGNVQRLWRRTEDLEPIGATQKDESTPAEA